MSGTVVTVERAVQAVETGNNGIVSVQDETVHVVTAGMQGPAGVSGITDHGLLTGLADDDHPHYHNDARGDARYYTQAQVTASLAGKSNVGHTHSTSDVSGLGTAATKNTGTSGTTVPLLDGSNTFSNHQLLSSANEIRLRASGQRIYSSVGSTLDMDAATTLNFRIGGAAKASLDAVNLNLSAGIKMSTQTMNFGGTAAGANLSFSSTVLTLQAYRSSVAGAGTDIILQAGNALGGGIPDYDGGNVTLLPGNGSAAGLPGNVRLATTGNPQIPGFQGAVSNYFEVDGAFFSVGNTFIMDGASLIVGSSNGSDARFYFHHDGSDFIADPNDGTAHVYWNPYQYDTDFVVGTTGDSSAFYVDAGNNRVGVGTASPAFKLDVNGMANVPGTSGNTYRWNASAAAPSTASAGSVTNRYGGGTNFLGDPAIWALVNVNGTNYKLPLYS